MSEAEKTPLCSVVIPWYRGIADLQRAVDSVLAQDYRHFEIIVVANGVDDAAFKEVSELYGCAEYRVARLETAGASPARNLGQNLARGELIFFLDADDRFYPGKLQRFVDHHRDAPFDLAFSRGMRLRGGNSAWQWPVKHWDSKQPLAEFFFCDGCTISSSAIVVSARCRHQLQFSESARPYEDPELIIRAEQLGLSITMLPDVLYDYFDDRTDNRLSTRPNWSERLAWIDGTPSNVSEKARAAFRTRCVAQHLFPHDFAKCLALFWDAYAKDAIPTRDLALFMVRGLIPYRLKRSLVDRYYSARAEHFADVESRSAGAPSTRHLGAPARRTGV